MGDGPRARQCHLHPSAQGCPGVPPFGGGWAASAAALMCRGQLHCHRSPRDAIGTPQGMPSGPPQGYYQVPLPPGLLSVPLPGHICSQPSRERTCPEHGCKWGGWIPSSSTDSLLGSCPSAPGNFGVHPSFLGC